MRIAIYPGSFDPITNGHLDIIRRAAPLFDQLIVLVVINPDKRPTFSHKERLELIQRVVGDLPNVQVDTYQGLLADYVTAKGACALVKGLRAVTDFEYDFQMALVNKKLAPQTETVFLVTSTQNLYVSSSLVKQVAQFGGDISDFVPEQILPDVTRKLSAGRNNQE